MPVAAAITSLERARRRTRQAIELWDGADLRRIELCRARLKQAEADLRKAIGLLRQRGSEISHDMAEAVASLRDDITRMTRLVDGGSAFLRELSLPFCDLPPVYGASGRPIAETSNPGGVAG